MSEHETLAAALVAALAELTNVTKTHRAHNAPGKHTFANIADVVTETRGPLAKHGIVALQSIHEQGDQLACTTVLLHESGDKLEFGPFTFPHSKDAQLTGSWVTYVRRYSMLAALGMAAEDEDDDGVAANAGSTRQPRRKSKPASPEPITPDQMTKLSVAFREAGIEDRDERLSYCADKVGRELESSKELTKAEASSLIDEVETLAKVGAS